MAIPPIHEAGQTSTETGYTRRFQGRLQACLDSSGIATKTQQRASFLSAGADIDVDKALALLSGRTLPSWPELQRLCALTNRQPGWFLDETPNEIPRRTKQIECLGQGEPITIALPPMLASEIDDESTPLAYFRLTKPLGFASQAGDIVIAHDPARVKRAIHVNKLYLVETEARFELRRCTEILEGRAVFSADAKFAPMAEPLMCPVDNINQPSIDRTHQSDPPHFGAVAAVLRLANRI